MAQAANCFTTFTVQLKCDTEIKSKYTWESMMMNFTGTTSQNAADSRTLLLIVLLQELRTFPGTLPTPLSETQAMRLEIAQRLSSA